MKQIIVIKPKSLTREAIKQLNLHGLIVIEHKNPNEVRIITPLEGVSADIVFQSMIKAIRNQANAIGNKAAESFGAILCKGLLKDEIKE